jgi:hypothetical protein
MIWASFGVPVMCWSMLSMPLYILAFVSAELTARESALLSMGFRPVI